MNEDPAVSRENKHSVVRNACIAALALGIACQQAKGDDVVTGPGEPSPPPSQPAPEGDLMQPASDAGRAPAVDSEGPGSLIGEPAPAASDAGEQSGLPADPLAVAPSFPIVFRSNRSAEGSYELYVTRADGSQPQRLTRGGDFLLPRWSPDGSRILFRRLQQGEVASADIGIVSANGAEVTMLTTGENPTLFSLTVSWSPDGARIAFGSSVPNEGISIYGMAPSGGQRERLLPEVVAYQREATWSPVDATRIVYIEAASDGRATALRLIDADNPGAGLDLTTGKAALPEQPRWSPDGTRIVFAGFSLNPDGTIKGLPGSTPLDGGVPHIVNLDLFVLELATGEVTQLTDSLGDDYEPAWSPDGTQILFTSARDGDEDLWLMPLADPEQAINLIDDNLDRHQDGGADWYAPPR